MFISDIIPGDDHQIHVIGTRHMLIIKRPSWYHFPVNGSECDSNLVLIYITNSTYFSAFRRLFHAKYHKPPSKCQRTATCFRQLMIAPIKYSLDQFRINVHKYLLSDTNRLYSMQNHEHAVMILMTHVHVTQSEWILLREIHHQINISWMTLHKRQ